MVQLFSLRIMCKLGWMIAFVASGYAQDMSSARLKQIEMQAATNQEVAFQLGYAYLKGTDGLSKDLAKAKVWLKSSADNYSNDIHVARSAYVLGQLYIGLEGHDEDKQQAQKYFSKAAEYSGVDAFPDAGYLAASVTDDDVTYITLLEKSGLAKYLPALLELYTSNASGVRTPVNEKAAIKWLKMAAKIEHPEAQALLGSFYFNGHLVYQDYERAYYWTVRAAEQNNVDAQGRLGLIYQLGLGRPADLTKAQIWYERAANQGHVLAKENLATLFLQSNDPEKHIKGIGLLEELANAGIKTAALALVQIYESGVVVDKDPSKTLYWQKVTEKLRDIQDTQLIGQNPASGNEKKDYRVNSLAVQHYKNGINFAQSEQWHDAKLELEKSALMNYPAAQLDLGRVLISIAQTDKNDELFESAYAWVKIANEANQEGAAELLQQISEVLPTQMLHNGLLRYQDYKIGIQAAIKK